MYEVIFVLSMIVGGVLLCVICVFGCRCFVLVPVVYPVAILSAVFCVICRVLMFVADASGDHMVETYSSMGLTMGLHGASIVAFCFSCAVDVISLRICIVLLSNHSLILC